MELLREESRNKEVLQGLRSSMHLSPSFMPYRGVDGVYSSLLREPTSLQLASTTPPSGRE
ncbi:hypothetical protein [Sulfuracidifex tepidarius]